MNYSEMSDVEIALAVGKLTSFDGLSCIGSSGKAHIHDWDYGLCTGWKEFDPCNSWADAGPIIQENYLSVECDDMFDVPMPSSYWKAHNPKGNHYTDKNPRRAAMIAFLMMQEEK